MPFACLLFSLFCPNARVVHAITVRQLFSQLAADQPASSVSRPLQYESTSMVSVAVVATIQGHNEISENLFDEDHHTDILAATQLTIMGSKNL